MQLKAAYFYSVLNELFLFLKILSIKVRCGSTKPIICDNQCSKMLNCGVHSCEDKCHDGK